MKERVLVVETELLPLPETQYIADPQRIQALLEISQENYRFLARAEAEADPGYKQLIPYVTILCQDEVLVLERTSAQSEERLHGKLSLGVGGHIDWDDRGGTLAEVIARAMARELREELWLETTAQPVLQGLINDDTNAVGSVHLGLHYLLSVPTRPRVRETEKMTAAWRKPAQLEALRPRLETWSQILLPALVRADHL